ncbi:MAG: hypothetical protein KDD02_20575, partial [Phaeodactylibacter sp.]|nr:hypothetical protein [Phaeodactylibacter sp.]
MKKSIFWVIPTKEHQQFEVSAMSKSSKKIRQQPAATPQPKAAEGLRGFPAWFSNTRTMQWMLFAFSFLLYANTLFHDYALDDAIVVYDNMFVQDGLSGIPGILS